jgi:hypothetical protein
MRRYFQQFHLLAVGTAHLTVELGLLDPGEMVVLEEVQELQPEESEILLLSRRLKEIMAAQVLFLLLLLVAAAVQTPLQEPEEMLSMASLLEMEEREQHRQSRVLR